MAAQWIGHDCRISMNGVLLGIARQVAFSTDQQGAHSLELDVPGGPPSVISPGERIELQGAAHRYGIVRDLLVASGCPLAEGCHVPSIVGDWLKTLIANEQAAANAVKDLCEESTAYQRGRWEGAEAMRRAVLAVLDKAYHGRDVVREDGAVIGKTQLPYSKVGEQVRMLPLPTPPDE